MKTKKRFKKAFWGIVGAICVIGPCLIIPVSAEMSYDDEQPTRLPFTFDTVTISGGTYTGTEYLPTATPYTTQMPTTTNYTLTNTDDRNSTTSSYVYNYNLDNTTVTHYIETSKEYFPPDSQQYIDYTEDHAIYTPAIITGSTMYEARLHADYWYLSNNNMTFRFTPKTSYTHGGQYYTNTTRKCEIIFNVVYPISYQNEGNNVTTEFRTETHIAQINQAIPDWYFDFADVTMGDTTIGAYLTSTDNNQDKILITDITVIWEFSSNQEDIDGNGQLFTFITYNTFPTGATGTRWDSIDNILDSWRTNYIYEVEYEPLDFFPWIFDTLDGILNTTLFFNITFGSILWFVVGLSLFVWTIKVFAGG